MNYSNMYNNNPNPSSQYDWNFMNHNSSSNNNTHNNSSSMDLSEPLQEPVAFEGK